MNSAMQALLLCLIILSISVASRDPGFKINASVKPKVLACYQIDPVWISRGLSPSLESVPSLLFFCSRRSLPLPRVRLSFGWSLLLLLAGDVSTILALLYKLNFRLRTVNARSMRDKAAVLSDLVHGHSAYWLAWHYRDLADREGNLSRLGGSHSSRFLFLPNTKSQEKRRWGFGLFVSSAYNLPPLFCLPILASNQYLEILNSASLAWICWTFIVNPDQLVHSLANFRTSVPLLRSLHWLPKKFGVEFKTCLLTFKTFNENQPDYLYAMLTPSVPSRSLRSNNGINFSVPKGWDQHWCKGFSLLRPHSVE